MRQSQFPVHQVENALASGLAFAVWSLPDSDVIESVVCEPSQVIELFSAKDFQQQNGFVFAPFQVCKHLPMYQIPFGQKLENINPPSHIKRTNLIADTKNLPFSNAETETNYKRQINSFLDAFKQTGIRKAVLSRNKWITKYHHYQMPKLFNLLIKQYSSAFVYQIYIPQAGYWVGATPELLLSAQNGTCTTVSLAGTQPYTPNANLVWNQKERIEQELVTEHIRQVLHDYGIHDFTENGPFNEYAGSIAHLKTTLNFEYQTLNGKLGAFIQRLHPTPAVCGLPVDESLNLIMKTEQYDRQYYTGYLGPIEQSANINLFVNLRCLQAFENGVMLYAGGGITPDSDPDAEWEETRLKIQTLEHILEQL